MLTLSVAGGERFDASTNTFYTIKPRELVLEHSLVSLSKWESKWNKPFLTDTPMTLEETIDYIRCMTLTQNVDPKVYTMLTPADIEKVSEYINLPMTATTFSDHNKKKGREIITAELIYYWMIALNIPFECQKWHLNKLITLVRVCSLKNEKPKKTSKREILNRNRELNEIRKKQLNTRG